MSEMEQQPICKIALGIEYDGSKYYGWQRQNEVRSVQEKLEKALSQVTNRLPSFAPAAPTPASMAPARWCISKPGRSGKMPPGRWG
jgi:tRNA pseudouridine38-40 synthase